MRESTTAVAAGVLIILGALMSVILLMDAGDAKADRRKYELVHQIPVEQYITRNYGLAVVAIAAVTLGILRFVDRKRRMFWGWACILVVAASFLAAGAAYSRWAGTGFDH